MDNKKLAHLEIKNHKLYIPAVISFLDSLVSNHTAYDISRYNQLRFIVTELLKNRVEKAYTSGTGKIYVDFSIVDHFFEVSVRDMGVPEWLDLNYDKSLVTTSNNDFRKFVVDMCIDSAGMEKLGKDGQRIFVRQRIANPLAFQEPEPYKEIQVLDKNITIKAVETEEDAIEAIRCIYSEYGYSYSYERLYYVDNLLRMIKDGQLMSFLAVNEHGQTAGHYALAFSDLFKNMPELSTVVTRKEFRGMGLFNKFMEHCLDVAQKQGFRAVMGQPVAFHPISQKAFIKGGFTPTSLLLSYINPEAASNKNPNDERLDLFACVKMIHKNIEVSLFPPAELREFTEKIYEKLGCGFKLGAASQPADDTYIKIENNSTLKMKRVVLSQAGENIQGIMEDVIKDSIRNKDEMIELFISLRSPTCEYAYNTAKDCRFKFSGIIPGAENDDYLVMQLLLRNQRHYDQLITVGEFEELTNNIISLAE